jgi:hypothetical protein
MATARAELLVVHARTLVISPTAVLERGVLVVDLGTGFVLTAASGDVADAFADAIEQLPSAASVSGGSREMQVHSLPAWLRVKLAATSTSPDDIVMLSLVRHDGLVIPGLVDIHTHGVGGSRDVLKYWHTPNYTRDRCGRAGTTSLLASVVFDEAALDVSFQSCAALRECVRSWRDGCGAVIEGIHAEGPVVATLGGLPQSGTLAAESDAWFAAFVDRVAGPERALRMMTVSPSSDAPRGYARIRALCRAGVVPALGHDKVCTEEQILGALRVGTEKFEGAGEEEGGERGGDGQCAVVRGQFHLTHGFNVQTFHHRDCGLANFAAVGALPRLPRCGAVAVPLALFWSDATDAVPCHPNTRNELSVHARGCASVCRSVRACMFVRGWAGACGGSVAGV